MLAELYRSGAKGGATNLTCPSCRTQIDTLAFTILDPSAIRADEKLICLNCNANFWPENALLLTLDRFENDTYFGYPISLGGGQIRNHTTIEVGKTRTHDINRRTDQYEVETISLRGAHRKEIPKSDWLPLNSLNNPFRRAKLGDEAIISLAVNSPATIAASTNLIDRTDGEIELGDEITILYDANINFSEAFDPPWVLMLREATMSIRHDNTTSVLPLLISAFDNLLYRQLYLLLLNRGVSREDSINKLQSFKEYHHLDRDDLAKQAMEFAVGERLSNGRYSEEWAEFKTIVNDRSKIVHPTSSQVSPPTTVEAIDIYDDVVQMMLRVFDLCWKS